MVVCGRWVALQHPLEWWCHPRLCWHHPPSGWQGVYLGSINTDLSAEEWYSALLYQYVAGTTLTKPTLPHQTHLQVPELRPRQVHRDKATWLVVGRASVVTPKRPLSTLNRVNTQQWVTGGSKGQVRVLGCGWYHLNLCHQSTTMQLGWCGNRCCCWYPFKLPLDH